MLRERLSAWQGIFRRKGTLGGAAILANSLAGRLARRWPGTAAITQHAPPALDVEVSTVCNLRCAGCLHGLSGDFHRAQPKFLSLERFQAIMDQVGRQTLSMNLTTLGEAFLHPQIYDIITMAKAHHLCVHADTNGHILDLDKVLDCGLDEITFAVDGFTQEDYAAYRRGGDLAKVLGNIEALGDLAMRRGSDIRIQVKYLVSAFSEGTIEQARAHFSRIPNVHFFTGYFLIPTPDWDFFRQSPYFATPELHALWAPKKHREYDAYTLNEATGLYRLSIVDLPFVDLCPMIHHGIYIHCNGDAYPCCHAAGIESPEFLIGNVFEQGVREVYCGDRARALREQYKAKGGRFSLCQDCISNRLPGQPMRSHEARSESGGPK